LEPSHSVERLRRGIMSPRKPAECFRGMPDDNLPLQPRARVYPSLNGLLTRFPSLSRLQANGETNGKSLKIPKGCDIHWTKICVYGPSQKPTSLREKFLSYRSNRPVEILHEVSGVARAGRLLAIMGSSGAGKTTLLNVLTSRNLSGLDVNGFVTVDGDRVSKWRMKEISAFVQQHDMFIGTLTAREHLRFMAKMRMGSGYTTAEQHLRVEDVIRKMGLLGCADTKIGTPDSIKGLSCGEQKRLSFASEILTCPRILFCDEPTSGLDAFMAGRVVASLRELADGGMTVVITIHQPSSQVYSLFNDVCLMACGRIIYLGPSEEATALFERCGFPCPDYCNPSDHLIRTLSVIVGQRRSSLKTISKIRNAFRQTPQGRLVQEISERKVDEKAVVGLNEDKNRSFLSMQYPASFCAQTRALTWRAWLTVIRDPMLLNIRLLQTVIIAVLTGMVYFQTAVRADTVISINGILFNHVRNLNFMLQFPAVPAITSELAIVFRENSNGIYSSSSYFIGKNLAELPEYIILPTIYNLIVYWMSGLVPNLWTFLFASLICALLTSVAISVSYACATLFERTDVAMTFLPIFVVPMLAFGGFFITFESIPSYFKWLSALSYFKYGYEALAINEWEVIDKIPGCQNSTSGYRLCPKSGSEVLKQIDFDGISKWTDVFILSSMIVVIRLIAYVALVIRAYRSR
ncbi:hypothetical protein V3C99_002790, partial [Haemonchus contortus]